MLNFIKKYSENILLLLILIAFVWVIVVAVTQKEIQYTKNEGRWVCVQKELTSYDFDIFKLESEKSLRKLWLNNWRVIYTFWESRDGWWRARFIDNTSLDSHYAIIELNKYWVCWDEPYSEESIRWLARHEVWHLMVADLVRELNNWKDDKDIYEEEKVAHTIANLLE